MGRYWQYGGLSCAYWKYPVAKPLKSYAAKGSPTIVVIGTTGDPATPYQQAVNLANKVLSNATLITYKGEGHTAYGQGHACVDNAVDDFFVSGTLPAPNLTCQ
jgi:pimeloyl-ACP methyl ester carboxylesterase